VGQALSPANSLCSTAESFPTVIPTSRTFLFEIHRRKIGFVPLISGAPAHLFENVLSVQVRRAAASEAGRSPASGISPNTNSTAEKVTITDY
jgi:hypothetical protein